MIVVIFEAEIRSLDGEYQHLAKQLRQLATEKYRCLRFESVTEGEKEIAVSYWHSLEDVNAWKADPLHQKAQQKGRAFWYRHYTVTIAEVLHQYEKGTP